MNAHELALARAASKMTPADLDYLHENGLLSQEAADSRATVTQEGRPQETASPGKKTRKRRKAAHQWPEVGTVLTGDYHGVHYEAEVIQAPRYKSGRVLRILTGPAAGKVSSSYSGAMLKATEAQRQEQGLGRKGVANGWAFWRAKGGGDGHTE